MYPFPFPFWRSGASRKWADLLGVQELRSFTRIIPIAIGRTEQVLMGDNWNRVVAPQPFWSDSLGVKEIRSFVSAVITAAGRTEQVTMGDNWSHVVIPPDPPPQLNPPTGLSLSDVSFCNAGTPVYRGHAEWTAGDLTANTVLEYSNDAGGSWHAWSSEGAGTEQTDAALPDQDFYQVRARHELVGWTPSNWAYSGVVEFLNPCG